MREKNLHFIHNKTSPRAMSRAKEKSLISIIVIAQGEENIIEAGVAVAREISDLKREIESECEERN